MGGGGGGNSHGLAFQNTNKSCGGIRFRRSSGATNGKGNARSTPTSFVASGVSCTPDGPQKKDKEKGRFRAVCAKFARQGSGANLTRSKDVSLPGQTLSKQTNSSSCPTSSQQTDPTSAKTQQSGVQGASLCLNPAVSPPIMRCLLLARVCLGEVYKAVSPMPDARMPPNKPTTTSAKLAYDSVMAECRTRGGVVDGVEFVVFERAQALPEFIITYSHAPHCQCAECHRQPAQ
ncbi:hypothetical protein, conserved [Eimeria tenella]|uniref:Uncharacterized protein n=1 Tax=Eimeria tenella TaxID=5802 RepID=U6KQT4_EIMTE|nr:hypothetical protein, conserved [Eimeria tenella]CDJ40442.1 hypothetical protein, conserved [Eimeria tenella]|eukprot:XP_013231192.1 hypothetical protein, conserved [Eimeria tenella]